MNQFSAVFLAVCILLGGIACDTADESENARGPAPAAVPAPSPAPAAPASQPARPRIVFLGDSLTAGYGVDADQAFPALIGEQLAAANQRVDVVNAGVSGDTTAGGLGRLDWLLRQKPDILVIGLGGNDGLRGLPLEASEQNLRAIIQRARAAGSQVLLLGMMIPPNYGPDYVSGFRQIYPRLAEELQVALVPFLLEGVGGELRLNQADGIHPTPAGHQVMAQTVLPHLRDLLKNNPRAGTRAQPVEPRN